MKLGEFISYLEELKEDWLKRRKEYDDYDEEYLLEELEIWICDPVEPGRGGGFSNPLKKEDIKGFNWAGSLFIERPEWFHKWKRVEEE